MTGTTSSTPELRLEVTASGQRVPCEASGVEVPGRGDLVVRISGGPPGGALLLRIGDREVSLHLDEGGAAAWTAPGLLAGLAGRVEVSAGDRSCVFSVRPTKVTTAWIAALLEELDAVAAGLGQATGGASAMAGPRSRDEDLARIDQAVGLAASAAPSIRRRPLHRSREEARAVPRDGGARTARDVRWLATHPAQEARASSGGRRAGVVRSVRRDLDTLENRGVLSAYDRMDAGTRSLRDVVAAQLGRLRADRPAREAFLVEGGSLWSERDAPRYEALRRRLRQLDALVAEVGAVRARSGLPDLRPRGPRMVRTPRVDAEPAYWATFRAFELVEGASPEARPSPPAAVAALDELWEQWCTVALSRALAGVLGAPDRADLVEPGWYATLRSGEVATWSTPSRTIRLLYEPEIPHAATSPRKLHPGRPWRPDGVVEVRWADGTLDLHVFDAKFRTELGGAPWSALQEIWFKYAESIGDAAGMPVVRSVWALWPGDGLRLVGPAMLEPAWPIERVRGGTIGLRPGASDAVLTPVLVTLLGAGAA